MAAIESLLDREIVCELVENGHRTFEEISEILQEEFPNKRGLSVKSLKRYCHMHEIKRRQNVADNELDEVVKSAVEQVGPVFGRKMMKGYIGAVLGTPIACEARIGRSLSRVAPVYQQRRRSDTARLLNPVPYTAAYYGHKLHIDQNEKLAMFGVTHVCAIDGYSKYIPAYCTMSVKNNLVIYENIYRFIATEEGLFDQIRVDHGKEFYLSLFVQEQLAHLRYNPQRDPHRQTTSKKNLPIERFWVEVNSRVNYPIKHALKQMEEEDIIDMECDGTKFSVSEVTQEVALYGLQMTVQAWNNHVIPGKGKPRDLRASCNHASRIFPQMVPDTPDAASNYEAMGGQLTTFSSFGQDPLAGFPLHQQQRDELFHRQFDASYVFGNVVNGHDEPFREAIKNFSGITRGLIFA